MLKKLFNKYLNYELTDKQVVQFDTYYDFLVSYNEHTNLTRITNKEEAYVKHFLDSCLLGLGIDFNQVESICDMGAGAGFPSIPLLMIYPNLKVTIVESQIKRVEFLNQLKEKLNLEYEVVHERAEVYALKNQQKFDVVTARALGELNIILEYGIPMLKIGGIFIAPKGSKYEEEIKRADKALKILNSKISHIENFELENMGFRANIYIIKEKHQSGYPRAYAKIIKNPL